MNYDPIAHVRNDEDGYWVIHKLDDHLRCVAALASDFASGFDAGHWAEIAGLWHDMGKYRCAFQTYIKKASGYDLEAHIEQGQGRVDRSTAGAIHANDKLKGAGQLLAY